MSRLLFSTFDVTTPGPPPAPTTSTSTTATKTGAVSSAVQLADLALLWSSDSADADLALVDMDLASDRGLMTALLLSWFIDRRAKDDDVPPSGDPNDRRGWWADEFADVEGDLIGSRIWLLDRSQVNTETILRAKQYLAEAHQWMIDDRVVEGIDLTITAITSSTGSPLGMLITGDVLRPGKDPIAFRFAHTWAHVQEDF